LLAGALTLLLAAAASAQPFETPPPPAAPRPLAIAAPVEQALPNGLRVIVAPREGVPLVTAMLVVLSGSELDPPQLSGLASMTASLLTQGTRRHTGPRSRRRPRRWAARWRAAPAGASRWWRSR
jgi:zinc protease